MKIAENVLLRNIESPYDIVLECNIGDKFLCPTLFGLTICKIKEFGDMGNIWAESEHSLFLLEKVENGIMQCLQIDKRVVECDFK